MTTNPNIFKAYDIRGIYPDEINEDAAYKIGRAVVMFFSLKEIVVGRDMRQSSPKLLEALAKGITDQGASVIDIGMVATPMLSFAVMKWNKGAGIMISASHNPGVYNAFKIVKNGGVVALQVCESNGMKEIKNLVLKDSFKDVLNKGEIIQKDITPEYKERLLSIASQVKNLKVVLDYGNGVGSLSTTPVISELPIKAIELFKEPDGNFPNHEANPHDIENLSILRKKVVAEKADLGIFFDGDADRSVIVDENGEIIFPDIVLSVLAINELEKHPGEKVYYDLRFTKAVREAVAAKGGIPIMMRVGNPFYKEALGQGGVIAGEFSGHIMYKDHYAIDDGLYSALKLMSIMAEKKQRVSELARPLQKYFPTEEINIKMTSDEMISNNLEYVKSRYADGELNTLDGILISYPDWWFSIRKSNTEPLIRIRMEANTKALLDEKRNELLKLIEK